MAYSGEICEACHAGAYTVYSSMQVDDSQVQYLRCSVCKHRPSDNKVIQPADSVRRRLPYLRNRLSLKRR
jgi:hypothetical protein